MSAPEPQPPVSAAAQATRESSHHNSARQRGQREVKVARGGGARTARRGITRPPKDVGIGGRRCALVRHRASGKVFGFNARAAADVASARARARASAVAGAGAAGTVVVGAAAGAGVVASAGAAAGQALLS